MKNIIDQIPLVVFISGMMANGAEGNVLYKSYALPV